MRRATAIDVFSGAGGLSEGFRQAGWDVRWALDWDEDACASHAANHPECHVERLDVREATGRSILAATGLRRVLCVAGGPNCQGVSEAGKRDPGDPRNSMFKEFRRIISELEPEWFVMENVPGLVRGANFDLCKSIFASFRRLGYRCAGDVLLAADYGAPQLRWRFFLVGTRGDAPLVFPAPTHSDGGAGGLTPHVTVWDAIGDLPRIGRGGKDAVESSGWAARPSCAYQVRMREGCGEVRDHECTRNAEINLDRVASIPEGGNWKDLPPGLMPERFLDCRLTDHSTTYGRLRRDHPSFTVTCRAGNVTVGSFIHPVEDRALSIREAARLQGFPDRYRFRGDLASRYRQVGNAVPPPLATAVARTVLELASGRVPERHVKPRLDERSMGPRARREDVPVLTPRYARLFGGGTRWPKGWGPEPADRSKALDRNYRLTTEAREAARASAAAATSG